MICVSCFIFFLRSKFLGGRHHSPKTLRPCTFVDQFRFVPGWESDPPAFVSWRFAGFFSQIAFWIIRWVGIRWSSKFPIICKYNRSPQYHLSVLLNSKNLKKKSRGWTLNSGHFQFNIRQDGTWMNPMYPVPSDPTPPKKNANGRTALPPDEPCLVPSAEPTCEPCPKPGWLMNPNEIVFP